MAPPKKNAFICFVETRRQDEEAQNGITLSLQEGIAKFGAEWVNMTSEERELFRIKAGKNPASIAEAEDGQNQQKQHSHSTFDGSIPPEIAQKFQIWRNSKNSYGQTMDEVYQDMRRDVGVKKWQRFLISRLIEGEYGDPQTKRFVLIQFNTYARTVRNEYIPAEVGMTAFSLREGIIDNYSSLIDPGAVVFGYRDQFHENIKKLAVPTPPFNKLCQEYKRIWNDIIRFMDKYPTAINGTKGTTYLFAHPDELEKTHICLEWIGSKAVMQADWEILPYSALLFQLTQYSRKCYITWLEDQRKLEYAMARARVISRTDNQTWRTIKDEDFRLDIDMRHIDTHKKPEPKDKLFRTAPFTTYSDHDVVVDSRTSSDDGVSYSLCTNMPPTTTINDNRPRARIIPRTDAHKLAESLEKISIDNESLDLSEETISVERLMKRFHIYNLKSSYKDKEIFVLESQAEEYLSSRDLADNLAIVCPHHMINESGIEHCPLGAVNRYIYNTLDILVGFLHIRPVEGLHYPHPSDPVGRRLIRHWVQQYHPTIYEVRGQNFTGSESEESTGSESETESEQSSTDQSN